MIISVALRNSPTARTLLNKLFNPVLSVSAIPSVQRSFNTNFAQVSFYDDFNRIVDEDRRRDSDFCRLRDIDFFSDVFDPFSSPRSLSQIFNMMDHMREHMMDIPRGPALGARCGWDAKEDDDSLSLRFDMPGLDKDNVKICVEDNTLVIEGEAEKESEDEEEEPAQTYSTRLDLPIDVFKLSEIKAEMKNGVLKIVVPKVKAEEKKDVLQVEVK